MVFSEGKSLKFSMPDMLFVFLVFSSIIPDVGIRFQTAGFNWTGYRLIIAITIISIILIIRRLTFNKTNPEIKWLVFMTVWAIQGVCGLFLGEYTNIHKGFIEWLSIFNGLVVIYVMNNNLVTDERRKKTIRMLYYLLNFFVITSFIEILTGLHWKTSGFVDMGSAISQYSNHHMATGLMYNMNDFSALLTCLSPILICKDLGKGRVLSMCGIILVNQINDATTCNLAIVIFGLYYILVIRGGRGLRALIQKLVLLFICAWVILILAISGTSFSDKMNFVGALFRQIKNAQNSSGSLFARAMIYKEALLAWKAYGFWGMGPAGFSEYFTQHPSVTKLVNPHALFIEIITQYGIIIGGWFVCLLAWMFVRANRIYNQTIGKRRDEALMVIAFVIIYSITSFASSTFIGFSYQWLLIAIMSSYLYKTDVIGGKAYA